MRGKWNKWWTIGLIVIFAAGAGGGYWWWSRQEERPLQAALQTTPVRKGNLESRISGTGNIETVYRETLTASVAGTIASVKVKEGDQVKKGQVLATFEEEETESAENQIRSLELDLKKKRLDLESLQTQFKQAPDDDTRAELMISIQKMELEIESIREDIQSLQEEDDPIDPITAPIDGTLASFNIKEGDTIGGQNGTAASSLGEVVNYEQLQMVVGIDELDISKVKLDQPATILVEALPDQTFTGKVTAIAMEGTPSNGVSTFDVTIALDKADNLRAGMSAEASIIVEQKEDALYLPIEAVQSAGGQYFVLVPSEGQEPQSQASQELQGQAGQGRQGEASVNASNRVNRQMAAFEQSGVRRVQVQVGIYNEDFIEIVSGLEEGDLVVVPTAAATGSQNEVGAAGGFPGGIFPGGAGGFPAEGGFGGGGGGFQRTQGGGGGR